jgi:hypothetical protein
MFHPDTQFLVDHWTALARAPEVRGGLPARSALEPESLGVRLPRAFLAKRQGEDLVLRVAGGWIESFAERSLGATSLLDLWGEPSHALVLSAAAQAAREARPVVIVGTAGVPAAPVEVTVVPLRGPSGRPDVFFGLFAPAMSLSIPAKKPRLLTARVTVGVGEHGRPALSLAAVQGRRIA